MKVTAKEKTSKHAASKTTETRKSVLDRLQAALPGSNGSQPKAKNKPVHSVATTEQIAIRAYQIWQAGGCRHGFHEQDWLQAEEELCR